MDVDCSPPVMPRKIEYPNKVPNNQDFLISWDKVDSATQYVLQLSNNRFFNSEATTLYQGSSNGYKTTLLSTGDWYFRVFSLNDCGESDYLVGDKITVVKKSTRGLYAICIGQQYDDILSTPDDNESIDTRLQAKAICSKIDDLFDLKYSRTWKVDHQNDKVINSILIEMGNIGENILSTDTFIFFFSGHGGYIDTELFRPKVAALNLQHDKSRIIGTVDIYPNPDPFDFTKNYIWDRLLVNKLKDFGLSKKIIILDACHSGFFWGQLKSLKNVGFISSASAHGFAHADPESGESLFGNAFIDALILLNNNKNKNITPNENVTPKELHKEIKLNLTKKLPRYRGIKVPILGDLDLIEPPESGYWETVTSFIEASDANVLNSSIKPMPPSISGSLNLLLNKQDGHDDFRENWEQGINSSIWKSWGNPRPIVVNGGIGGSKAVNPNGNGTYQSGLTTFRRFTIKSGMNVSAYFNTDQTSIYWQNLVLRLTEKNANEISDTSLDDSVTYAYIYVTAESNIQEVRYGVEGESYAEPYNINDDQTFIKYEFKINSDGTVSFYKNGTLKFKTNSRINFTANPSATVTVDGRSYNTNHMIDNIVVEYTN